MNKMSKATHTARLKNIGETIEAMKANISYGTMYIKYLSYNEGSKIELTHHENDIYHSIIGGWSLNSEMLTNIQPIAKVIEIPEGDFYFKGMSGIYEVVDNDGYRISYIETFGAKSTGNISISALKEKLNEGTWTICEAPENKELKIRPSEWGELKNSLQDIMQSIRHVSDKFKLEIK